MKKSIIFYFCMNPYDLKNCYVCAHYANGQIKYWYPDTKGFKSAKAKAMRSKNHA